MSKLYRTSGTGNAQQTLDVNDEKIKIYADEASLDADLANIGENEIVATNEEDSQREGTQYPVDVVQDGNMNAVTSNAVYDALVSATTISSATSSNMKWLLQESSNGIIIGYGWNTSSISLNQGSAFIGLVPDGYRIVDIISGNLFADSNVHQATGAIHISSSAAIGIAVYAEITGTYLPSYIRVAVVLRKI